MKIALHHPVESFSQTRFGVHRMAVTEHFGNGDAMQQRGPLHDLYVL
jgi:hypothetical protein